MVRLVNDSQKESVLVCQDAQRKSAEAVKDAAMATTRQLVGDAKSSLSGAESSLGDAESSLSDAESSLGDVKSSLSDAKSSLGDAKSSLGDAKSSLGDAKSSLGDVKSSLGNVKSSLGDAESSLGDAKSSLGDAKSSLGDAKSSLGDAKRWLGDANTATLAPTARTTRVEETPEEEIRPNPEHRRFAIPPTAPLNKRKEPLVLASQTPAITADASTSKQVRGVALLKRLAEHCHTRAAGVCSYSDEKVANRYVRDFGWEIAHDARRVPSSRS